MGISERYYPRDGLVYVERWQKHSLQDFRNFESYFRPGVVFLFSEKYVPGRGGYFSKKLLLGGRRRGGAISPKSCTFSLVAPFFQEATLFVGILFCRGLGVGWVLPVVSFPGASG